jgi:hypothetical protein
MRSIRMPLAVGTTSLLPCAFGVGLVAFGAVLVAQAPGWGSKLAIIGVLAVVCGVALLVLAMRRRASDLVLGDEGFAVEGGPRNGRRARWSQLGSPPCELAEGARTRTLRVRIDGALQDLACARDDDEREALATLAVTIGAMARPEETKPAESNDVVRCSACGAVNKAKDVETIECAFCGARVEIATPVRARIRDAAEAAALRSGKEGLLTKLLRQPTAGTVNGLLFGSVPIATTALVLFFLRALRRTVFGHFIGEPALMIAFSLALTSTGLYLVLRRQFLRRRAVRLITMHFGARPPGRPGGKPTCRRCNAPLEQSDDAVFVDCDYCGAEHIGGMALVRAGGRELDDAATLASTLTVHEGTLRVWRIIGSFGLVLIVLGIALGPLGIRSVTVHALDWRCKDDKGDGEACWQAGDIVAPSDQDAAATFYWHGCRRWNPVSCKRLGALYITYGNSPGDAHDAYKRACDRGDEEGCCSLGCLFVRGQGVQPDPKEADRLFRASCTGSKVDWCNVHVPVAPANETKHELQSEE